MCETDFPARPLAPAWLLLKADARKLPLCANSVQLVLATPPALGQKGLGEDGFCTRDSLRYQRLLAEMQRECLRVLAPNGYLALFLHTGRLEKVCEIFQKRFARGGAKRSASHLQRAHLQHAHLQHAHLHNVRREIFSVAYNSLEGYPWLALPVSLYRNVVARYSAPGALVAHIFSGSGNGALACLELSRRVMMFDLHYHAFARRRVRASSGIPEAKLVPELRDTFPLTCFPPPHVLLNMPNAFVHGEDEGRINMSVKKGGGGGSKKGGGAKKGGKKKK